LKSEVRSPRSEVRNFTAAALALAAVFFVSLRADAPHVYAITGARIVTVAGAPIESGTLVIRNGFIDAVGAAVTAPADAMTIDGRGLTVYPGLIDMGTSAGLDVPASPPPQNARTRLEAERWKRQSILHPHLEAANYVRSDAPDLRRLASAGITSVLSLPPGDVVRGRSSLINVVAPDDQPQIGNIADERRGLYVVKTPVALHIALVDRAQGTGYPESLFGVIAFVRQALLDAQHYQAEWARYESPESGVRSPKAEQSNVPRPLADTGHRTSNAGRRPVYDQALDALQPALAGRLPVVFHVNSALDIQRALARAKEFRLTATICGAQEADRVLDDLKAQKTRLIFSLDLPARSRLLAPEADEPIRVIRQRANVPKVPGQLERAGILFAFHSGGLREPADFVRNAARVVKAGLSPDAAIKALTINAATMAGAADRLGSLEKGKIANVIVTDGDLFDEKTKVKHVFVDGRLVDLEAVPAARPAGGRRPI
jgi:imidazolonepropionase-like amidohydrolase